MKKSIIITAMALCFSYASVNAKSLDSHANNVAAEIVYSITPFCVSIAKGDVDTVKKLIELGVDVNQKSNGMTPVMYAAKYNRTEILKLLISKGAKLKLKSESGKTALDYAALHKATDAQAILKETLSKK